MIRPTAFVFGIISALLGGLWLLQGLRIVQLRPILCFADRSPIEGPSVTWAIVGTLALVVGGMSVFLVRKTPRRFAIAKLARFKMICGVA